MNEAILVECPAVVGPYTRDIPRPQCVHCFRLTPSPAPRCPRCHLPVCSSSCSSPHHAAECRLLRGAGPGRRVGEEHYAPVMALRLLALRSSAPDTWARFLRLEHHAERRREEEPELWAYHQEHVVAVVRRCGVELEEEEVHRLLGRMFTNCGDLTLGAGYGRGCGYYPTYANINHSC